MEGYLNCNVSPEKESGNYRLGRGGKLQWLPFKFSITAYDIFKFNPKYANKLSK